MKGNLQTLLLAAAAGAMMTLAAGAMAQAPTEGPGADSLSRGAAAERAGTIQRFGLSNAALKLTDTQKAEIDEAADAYVAEIKALNEKYPFTPGSPPSSESTAARFKARDALMAAVTRVLNNEQKQIFQAAQAPRRAPAGGIGRPGGARPPGQ